MAYVILLISGSSHISLLWYQYVAIKYSNSKLTLGCQISVPPRLLIFGFFSSGLCPRASVVLVVYQWSTHFYSHFWNLPLCRWHSSTQLFKVSCVPLWESEC